MSELQQVLRQLLIDALLIRMLVEPALMSLLGNRTWAMPSWLDRVIPKVDVEGESLSHRLEAPEVAELQKV